MRSKFFVNIIPGLESVSYLELCERWSSPPFSRPIPEAEFYRGGFEIETDFTQGCALNYYLRTANRILFRWHKFACPDIKVFTKVMGELPWTSYFSPGDALDIQYSSRSSKLSHQKQILTTLQTILKPHGLQIAKDGLKLFIRFFRDECQVSIDTTGDRGQFRGAGKQVGKASLRDNTAAGLLRLLVQGMDLEKFTLVDPMTGSGTFLLEALQMALPLTRDFNFSAPHIGNEGALSTKTSTCQRAIGFEKDQLTAAKARNNLKMVAGQWEVHCQDVFKARPTGDGPYVMIVNPPWGKRLPQQLRESWLEQLLTSWAPVRVGVLWPARPFPVHAGYKVVRHRWVENSGVKNQFVVLIPR